MTKWGLGGACWAVEAFPWFQGTTEMKCESPEMAPQGRSRDETGAEDQALHHVPDVCADFSRREK